MASRQCAFCDNPANDREHVWSKWIGELFPSKGYRFKRGSHDGTLLQQWSRRSVDEKTKVVCKPCNNGWMSNLEGRAKQTLSDMIRDAASLSLLPSGIKVLAQFAFKNAVIANHMFPQSEPFFPPAARHRFKTSLTIPPGIQMWVGAFAGVHAAHGRFNCYVGSSRAMPDAEFYVFTFVAGHLAFQVVAPRWARLHHRGRPLPFPEADPFWNTAATQFWPPDGMAVSWPPPEFLNEEAADYFVNRWALLPFKVWQTKP